MTSQTHGQRVRSAGRSGFTLLELTIVMFIVSVLAAILFPVFAKAREKGRSAQCLSNLQQIWLGLRIYAADNGGFYAPRDNQLDALYPRYLPHADVFLCPSAPEEVESLDVNRDYQYKGGLSTDTRPQLALASDDTVRHSEGVNFLFTDGHVKWLSGEMAEALIDQLSDAGLPTLPLPEYSRGAAFPEPEEAAQ